MVLIGAPSYYPAPARDIFVEQYRGIPGSSLMVIPNGGHDAVFREARPDFVRTALAFLRG